MKPSLWGRLNSIFEWFKRNAFLKMLYRLPFASSLYHFSLALLGAVLYGFPSRKIQVIGITGTKGKTTTVDLLHAILSASDKKTALLSSVFVKIGDHVERNPFGNSMPGRFFIQHFLRRAASAGCEVAAIEVTSQGVLLSRHRFIRFAAALITNLAPEHIEAHGSFENYREAKANFLRYVAKQGSKVFVNREDQGCEYFFQIIPAEQIVSYSTENLPMLSENIAHVLPGQMGRENIAAVASVARFFGVGEGAIKTGLENFKGVPGRVEYIQKEPFAVVVDYAHTPDSLRAIYSAFRAEGATRYKLQATRLICVLGAAGGGRDKWKRAPMGQVAGEMCDEIVLTNEDPYDEQPEDIIDQIAEGCSQTENHKSHVLKIIDRREAIKKAISLARPGDAVILTGKGSETSIHIAGGKTIPWNEREVVQEILRSRTS